MFSHGVPDLGGSSNLKFVQACQVGPCTPVCAAHSGLLDAKLGSVHPSVQPVLAFGAPTWPSKPHSKGNLAPLGLNLALQAALQVQLGASWVDFWCSRNPQNRALASTRAQFSWFKHFCSPSALGLQFHTCLASTWTSWTPLGLNLEPLGRLLGSTWSLLGDS